MSISPFSQTFAELPASLPVFPLTGAVVMPGSYLPLNIFEPRYINMVIDVMRGDQLIGMIQPRRQADSGSEPDLYEVGTCGRIVQYEETLDGRLNIVLNGLCRYRFEKKIATTRGYRMVVPDWSPFEADFDRGEEQAPDEYAELRMLLKNYIDQNGLDPKWKEVVDNVEPQQVVSNAISYLPFSPEDKQFLLETSNFAGLVSATIAVMQTHAAGETQH